MSRKQITRGGLAAPQILSTTRSSRSPAEAAREELRELAAQFLRMVSHLPCRPEPRHAWDNRARRDQRVPHPCADAIALARTAHAAAIETGNVEIIRATRLEIEEYFDLSKKAALALPARTAAVAHRLPLGAPSSSSAYLALIKEQSEATMAVATAQIEPNETTIAHARREVRDVIHAACEFLGIHSHSKSTRQVS
jgi:hypothetical protein